MGKSFRVADSSGRIKMPDKDEKNYGKGDRPDEEKPLKKTRVKVRANPRRKRNDADKKVAKKVREGVKPKIEEAIEEAKGGGYKKQLDAAQEALDKEAEKIPKRHVRKVRVDIDAEIEGDDGRPRGVDKRLEAVPKD
jgi:hypothetical protein